MSEGPVLRTARLELGPFGPEDAAALHALFADRDVRRYLLDGEVVSRDWVDAEIEGSRRAFQTHGWGLWQARLDGTLVGFAGYREFHHPPELELVYGFRPEWWGLGLATEAAGAVVDYAFETLGFDRVLACADAPNAASFRVMERLGLRFRERRTADAWDTLHYVLERADWKADGSRARPEAALPERP